MQLVVLILGVITLIAAIAVVLGTRNTRSSNQRAAGLIVPERSLNPPEQQTPGTVGPLKEGEVDAHDLRLTLLDLAARGYLAITALVDEHGRAYEWVLRRTTKPVELTAHRFEDQLLTTPFTADRGSTTLSGLQTMATRPLQGAEVALADHLRRQGWFDHEAKQKHSPWGWVGALILLAGLLLTVYELIEWLATNDFRGVIGGGLLLAAGVLLASRGRMRSSQTDSGEAARNAMTDYRQTLAELSAEELPPDEIAGLFNRLLPWAVAFGDHEQLATNVDAVIHRAAGWGHQINLRLDWFEVSRATDQTDDKPTAVEFSRQLAAFVDRPRERTSSERKSSRVRLRA